LFQEERIWDIMGDGGQVSGWMEEAEKEEEVEEEEEVEVEVEEEREKDKEVVEEEEVDEVGLWQREGRLRLRFNSEKLGMWRRRCERIVVVSSLFV
jgi:hypothetical protein